MSKVWKLISSLVVIAALAAVVPIPAYGTTQGEFHSAVNSLRTSKGLRPLTLNSTLNSIAQQWTAQMAEAGKISHNPRFSQQIPGSWTKVGENVGVGSSVESLMDAFIASPPHYANLVDPAYTDIGIGVVITGGRIFVTHNFAAYPGSKPATTSTTKPAPPTSKAPSPPTTTSPPTKPSPSRSTSTTTVPAPQPSRTEPPLRSDPPGIPVPAREPSSLILASIWEISQIHIQG